jgi:hypothetical protein
MTPRQILLAAVLAGFSLLTAYAVSMHGYVGVLTLHLASSAGAQVIADLVIALILVLAWMRSDARDHGLSFAPYALLTLALGSIGPLVYLLRRETRLAEGRSPLHAPAR